MFKSHTLTTQSHKLVLSHWIGRIATHPIFIVGFNLLLITIGLAAGHLAYVLMALAVSMVTLLLVSSDFTAGLLWILGISTVTGFYQRLILYRSGQSPSSDYVRLALEISILAYFVLLISSKFSKPVRIRAKWLDIVVTCYLLLSTLSAFNLFYVKDFSITIYGWRWVCIPILMYYLGRTVSSETNTLNRVDKYIIVLLFLQAGYGAYQSIIGYPAFEQPWIIQRAAMQPYAAVEDSMFIAGKARIPALTEGHTSGGFLIPVLFLWTFFLSGKSLSKRWRNLRGLALFFGLLYLIFSNERSAIGMVGLGIGSALFLRTRKKLGIGVFLVAIPALIIIILMMNQIDPSKIPWSENTIVLRRLLELLNPLKSGTLAGRMNVYWPVYWRLFLENPLGYGLGSFHATSATRLSDWGRSPHNMYLQVLLETGVIGLFLFVTTFFVYFKYLYNFNKMHLNVTQRSLVLGASSSYVAFLAIGMANQPIETFSLAINFWFLLGLVTTRIAIKFTEYKPASSEPEVVQ